jgi:hypothetical protein
MEHAHMPHLGWRCIEIADLGKADFVCEWCAQAIVRYVHMLEHEDYFEFIRAGSCRAGHLTSDEIGARVRERTFKLARARREKWLTSAWTRAADGRLFLNRSGVNLSVFPVGDKRFGAVVSRERGDWKPIKVAAFHLIYANKTAKVVGEDGKIKAVSWSKLWLTSKRRRQFTEVDDYPIGKEPRGAYNLWTGLAVTPKEGEWPTIKAFLLHVICAGSLPDYDYLLNLTRWKVQNPTLNPEVAISLQGLQGVGKGSFGIFLQIIFGLKRYRLFGRPDDVASRFNASAEGKLVLFFDEAVFAHDPKIRGKLKSEITEGWMTIEPKGIDAYEVRNRALRIFASNDAAPIAIDLDDRRVFVLRVAPRQRRRLLQGAAASLRRRRDGGVRPRRARGRPVGVRGYAPQPAEDESQGGPGGRHGEARAGVPARASGAGQAAARRRVSLGPAALSTGKPRA